MPAKFRFLFQWKLILEIGSGFPVALILSKAGLNGKDMNLLSSADLQILLFKSITPVKWKTNISGIISLGIASLPFK